MTDFTAKIEPPLLPEGTTIVINSNTPNIKRITDITIKLLKAFDPNTHTGMDEKNRSLLHRDFHDCGFRAGRRMEPRKDDTMRYYIKNLKAKDNFIDQVQLLARYEPPTGHLILSIGDKMLYDKKGVRTIHHLEDILEAITNGRD